MNSFKNKYRSADILLIDDIHFLENREGTQDEIFHTFNALYELKKQMVFTSDRPASELKNLTDRVKSRFQRGMNVDLQPPNFETRYAIISKKLELKNKKLSNEIIEFICKNVTTNVRDLEAALTKLLAYVDLLNKEITIEIAQQQLKDMFTLSKQSNITIEHIQRCVSEYFNLSVNDLRGKKRTKEIATTRQIAMYITRDLTEFSTTEIGQEFGSRDHTTVMHACQKIDNKIKTDTVFQMSIQKLVNKIKEMNIK
jgi:chromosomal replication initiator protein